MIPLHDFLSALMTESAKGHAAADAVSGEIAKRYKDDELLKNFTVPKLSISSMDFDINMAITEFKEIPKITEKLENRFNDEFTEKLLFIANNLLWPDVKSQKGLHIINIMQNKTDELKHMISGKIVNQKPLQKLISEESRPAFLSEISGQVLAFIEDSMSQLNEIKIKKLLPDILEKNKIKETIEKQNTEFFTTWYRDNIEKNPSIEKERLPMISVEPKELATLSPDKIIKTKIHMEIRPYEWTSMETEGEDKKKTIKYKLVPE